jgi:hypothetical protein
MAESAFHHPSRWSGELSWKVDGIQSGQIMSDETPSRGSSLSTTAGFSPISYRSLAAQLTLKRYFRKYASCCGVNTKRFSSAPTL